jgi:hypothetical protein
VIGIDVQPLVRSWIVFCCLINLQQVIYGTEMIHPLLGLSNHLFPLLYGFITLKSLSKIIIWMCELCMGLLGTVSVMPAVAEYGRIVCEPMKI